jgi:hypothetical protein
MKKCFIFVLIVLLTLVFALSVAIPAMAQDHGSKVSSHGFDVDQGDRQIQRGSTVHQLRNGLTEVTGPDNTLQMTARDLDSEFVHTPSGLAKANHVFNLPSGSEIENRGNETDIYTDDTLILRVIDTSMMTLPDFSGWLEQANNWSVSNLDYYSGAWTVPSSPINSTGGAVDFLFNAIEPNTGTGIIQPVLEWNQAGSHAWTLRSWYGPVNGNYYASSPVNAKVKDSISGVMSNSRSGWSIVSRDETTRRSTSLTTRSVGTKGLAVFCALEGYSVSSNADLPGTTTLKNLTFRNSGRSLNMVWQTLIDSNAQNTFSGLGVQASGGQVILLTANK